LTLQSALKPVAIKFMMFMGATDDESVRSTWHKMDS
jgi:hypothetical protein